MEEIKQQKQNIRDTVLVQCSKLDFGALAKVAVKLISKEEAFTNAKTVFAYKPFGHEIPFVNELRRQFPEKEYYFPQMEGKQMHFEHEEPDLIFVPAIAVDKNGNRLGRGWGCYDKFLSNLGLQGPSGQREPLIICVVPECAMVDNVPCEPHDMAVRKIIVVK